jgi:putative oxygen-independent coproporphyrinogen III oxidase
LPQVWGREIVSLFIGGGTPSLFSAAGIDRLLTMVRTLLRVNPVAEITLEANPGTFEVEKFRDYRTAGVNRLSLGIQSFDSAALERIGRIHDGAQARAAAQAARAIFDNLNLDLIYALPQQTGADLQRDLATALAIGPDHLSAYHLTLEPNTAFGHTPPANLPDDDAAAAMQDQIEAALAAAGYQHYETSAYARPHRAARHNLNYWQFGDYLGIGAGAHSKLSLSTGIVRQARLKHPQAFMTAAGTPAAWTETPVAPRDLPFEFMMNALRLTDGVEAGLFVERTGLPLLACAPQLAKARRRGLLEDDPLRLQPTRSGQQFLNDLLTLFLPD